MNQKTFDMLEFNKIKEILMSYAFSETAKDMIQKLTPSTEESIVKNWLKETTEAKAILTKSSSVPLHSLTGIDKVMESLGKGIVLRPDQLNLIWTLLDTGKKLIKFMKDKESIAPQVSAYVYSISDLQDLAEEIARCIRNGRVDDDASKALSKLRKKIGILEDRIKDRLERILKSSGNQDYFQDQLISVRDGRYVIPVKREYKRNIEGHVLDSSSSGATVYIEPEEVKKLQNELNLVKAEEDVEVERILSYLTGMVESYERELSINIETIVHYDFIFAKAKYSNAIDGCPVKLNTNRHLDLKEARHPLLSSAVPLDFRIGEDYRALVITGPNTGGKTVAIKTVGLLILMVQAGLHVPVGEGSQCAIFQDVFVDIGDGQNIEQSLSTFSSHMTNIIRILEQATCESLVILDELGTGTDPAEGKGLAISILEKLYSYGATILATTHYSEIKEFAAQSEGFENGSMEFDIDTLQPLYRLNIGKAGESQALSIAYRLGMNTDVLQRAHEITYKEKKVYLPRIESVGNHNQTDWRKGNVEKGRNMRDLSQAHKRAIHSLAETSNKPSYSTEKSQQQEGQSKQQALQLGDRVYVSSIKAYGIVCELENHKGEVGVLVQEKKLIVNKKRLTLQTKAQDLYPENYDLDIVLKSKEERKKSRLMGRKYVEGLKIEYPDDDHEGRN